MSKMQADKLALAKNKDLDLISNEVWDTYYHGGDSIGHIAQLYGVDKKSISKIIKKKLKSDDIQLGLKLIIALQSKLKEHGFCTVLQPQWHKIFFRNLPVRMSVTIHDSGSIELLILKSIDKWGGITDKNYEWKGGDIRDPNYNPDKQFDKIIKIAKNLKEIETIWNE